jgi:hypothetical protein
MLGSFPCNDCSAYQVVLYRQVLESNALPVPAQICQLNVAATAQVEYASAGRLADRCADGQRLAEPQARALFAQLLAGLAYCHGKGVYHRDLRTELLLLSGRHAHAHGLEADRRAWCMRAAAAAAAAGGMDREEAVAVCMPLLGSTLPCGMA